MRHAVKTPEQLRREISYYARQLQVTKSADRLERAHKAIRAREAALRDALKARVG